MARCVVLRYHVVDFPRSSSEARFCCPPTMFAAKVQHLADNGWRVIALSDLVAALRARREPPDRSVVTTFDDGTACTREHAVPMLQRLRFPARAFMVSALVASRNEWVAKWGEPVRAMPDDAQLRELDAVGIEAGSYTFNHVRLAQLPLQAAIDELRRSREVLAQLLGQPIRIFAYPYGNFSPAVTDAVHEAGYEGACSTRWGRNSAEADPFAIMRVEVMRSDRLWQSRIKLRSGTNDMPLWSVPRAAVKRALHGQCVVRG